MQKARQFVGKLAAGTAVGLSLVLCAMGARAQTGGIR